LRERGPFRSRRNLSRIEAFTVLVGVGAVFGLAVNRWWTLLVIPPAVVLLAGLPESVLPRSIQWWVAVVYGGFSAVGVVLGILTRRFANRFAKPSY
jgi:hypothetical protein